MTPTEQPKLPEPKTYKGELIRSMDLLAADPLCRLIGYGVRTGAAMGTAKAFSRDQLVETPVAENLMVGLGIGMALKGLKPIVFIERMDFLLNALDAIVNHLDKIKLMSKGEFNPTCIIRVVVGNKNKPLYTGATHTQNFSDAIRLMVNFPVYELKYSEDVYMSYAEAYADLGKHSTMLIEHKDLI